ncbi:MULTISPECIES: hypothetical protein [unclassified Pseudoalteromonas]|uniref:hypothetical protein n=1 Tax=unclassified Pseudoalteromonas TaxID=194690 RepID=UPI003014B030
MKLIFILMVLTVALVGCNSKDKEAECSTSCSCDGTGGGPSSFDINDFTLSIESQSEAEQSVPYQKAVFKLEAEVDYSAFNQLFDFNFSLINKAYACSPAPAEAKERITGIKVTSSAAFSDQLTAGTSLNEVFDIVYSEALSHRYYDSSDGTKDYYSITEFFENNEPNPQASKTMHLVLNTEPQYKLNHVFFIEITFDSGEQYSLQSQEISFTDSP